MEASKYATLLSLRSRIRCPLYSGEPLESLAAYIERIFNPLETSGPTFRSVDGLSQTLDRGGNVNEARIVSVGQLDDAISTSVSSAGSQGPDALHVIHLHGHQNPLCLATIGARYQAEELFYRHLTYLWRLRNSSLRLERSLPSTSSGSLQMSFFTVGEYLGPSRPLNELRKDAVISMSRYWQHLERDQDLKPGDSIIRDYRLHTLQEFSLEQCITVMWHHEGDRWTVVIWQDMGKPISQSPSGPWQNKLSKTSMKLLSTSRLPPGEALSSFGIGPRPSNQSSGAVSNAATQDCTALHPKLLDMNPWLLVRNLFESSAHSICRLLNLVEHVIDQNTGYNQLDPELDVSADLLYHQDILCKLTLGVKRNLSDIQQYQERWLDKKHSKAPERALDGISGIERDFVHLSMRIELLTRRCIDGMAMYMSSTAIIEAKKSISQAERIAQLTVLAFVYIPLSFSTSFFGMNMASLGVSGGIALWPWFAMSIPLLILSYGLLLGVGAYGKAWERIKMYVGQVGDERPWVRRPTCDARVQP